MSKLQQNENSKGRKNNHSSTKTKVVLSLLSAFFCIGLILIPSQAEALKIIVHFKYSDWQKDHPQTLNKITLNAYSKIDDLFKKLSLVKLPSTKTINLDVAIGKKFTVVLNSYATDDGEQNSGINHPAKVPEKLTVRVP